MDLRDFQQIQGYFQQLEFKVWEHSNLKVSNLTLKDQFFLKKKLVLLSMLRSKMLTKISTKNRSNVKKLVKILINYQYIDIFALYIILRSTMLGLSP